MTLLLGIDIGTSGTKVILWDAEGSRILGQALSEYELTAPRPGWAEQDPEDWWRATGDATRRAWADSGADPGDIAAIGLSGQMHGSVFLDAADRVVRPCILWCDNRTIAECAEITAAVGDEELHAYVANPALPGFTAPKVLWLRKNEPENFDRTASLLLPKDYIRLRLTGHRATEVSDAAGTILFGVETREWCRPLIEKLGLPLDLFPPVVESPDITGELTPEAADALGLRPGIPVVGGGADNAAGAVGSGVVREGRVLLSLGSSGVILTPSDAFCADPSERLHTFCASVPGQWYLMGCMLTAGLAMRWARDTLSADLAAEARSQGADPYELMMAEVARSAPGADGVRFLPHLQGERSPLNDPLASGVFAGLELSTTRSDLLRAVVEGITLNLAACLDVAQDLGCPVEEIRLTGGGAKSPLWRQICADIFDSEIVMLGTEAGPALGAALLAGVGAGVYAGVPQAACQVPLGERIAPRPSDAEAYTAIRASWKAIYPALRDWMAANAGHRSSEAP